MLMVILMTATIAAVYWFWIRPILKSRPAFADFYAREESVLAAVREKLSRASQRVVRTAHAWQTRPIADESWHELDLLPASK